MACISSEDQILSIIDVHFPREHRLLELGRGDDCAEFFSPVPLALSTDLFMENYHFRRSYFSPAEVGHKALAVNLSDLAAAGAEPCGFSLGLMCPPDLDAEWLDDMFLGMAKLAGQADIPLAGGDISAAPALGFSITVWGRSACMPAHGPSAPGRGEGERSFLRRGARPGDILFLVGPKHLVGAGLGLGKLGLTLLEKEGRKALPDYPQAGQVFLTPEPMLAAGLALADLNRKARAGLEGGAALHAMDLSDGLLRDLPRLLAGGAGFRQPGGPGADLTLGREELHPEILAYAAAHAPCDCVEREALALAFSGGDEYILLCACAPELFAEVGTVLGALPKPPALVRLGSVSGQPGIRWRGRAVESLRGAAFDHFSGTGG